MKNTYRLLIKQTSKRAILVLKKLVEQFPGVELDPHGGVIPMSENLALIRSFCKRASREGLDCFVVVSTEYTREDALSGELGLLIGAGSNQFRACLPKDAFDLTNACPSCGLGGRQVKPYLLAERSIRCKGPYFVPDESFRVLMRAEIGRELIQATGDTDCLRHPVTRSGKVVTEWFESVPSHVMPPLSPKSEGVVYKERCPVCERAPWSNADDVPERLMYTAAAIRTAQEHTVVAMHEPFGRFPDFDPRTGRLKKHYGLSLLLYSRKAVEVLAKYIEPVKGFPSSSLIVPVFAEGPGPKRA